MNVFKCDECGEECYINPPTELVYEPTPKKDEKGVLQLQKKPVMVDVPTHNPATGKIEKRTVQATRDLKLRCYIVRLSLGLQQAQKDLCEHCYKKHFDTLNATFRYIGGIGDT